MKGEHYETKVLLFRMGQGNRCFVMPCLALLYLILVSGHRPVDDAIYQNPLDRLWVDVSLLLMLGIFIFSSVFYLESISYFDSSSLSALLLSLFAAAAAGLLLALGLSVVRNLKGGTFHVTVDGDLFKATVTLPAIKQ